MVADLRHQIAGHRAASEGTPAPIFACGVCVCVCALVCLCCNQFSLVAKRFNLAAFEIVCCATMQIYVFNYDTIGVEDPLVIDHTHTFYQYMTPIRARWHP